MVSYVYDAWGRLISTDDDTDIDLGEINPLRYRGYVYDHETGLYYLQSRYYNPTWGRFINADVVDLLGANGDFASYNLFAYCGNNPTLRTDSNGGWWHLAIGALVGVATQFLWDRATGSSSTIVDYASAAISGAIAASGIGFADAVIANAVLSGATYLANCSISGEETNMLDLSAAVIIGGIAGAIGGSGADGAKMRGVISTSVDILETAVSPRKIAMYTGKIFASISNIVTSTVRTAGAGFFANAANTARKGLTQSAV